MLSKSKVDLHGREDFCSQSCTTVEYIDQVKSIIFEDLMEVLNHHKGQIDERRYIEGEEAGLLRIKGILPI